MELVEAVTAALEAETAPRSRRFYEHMKERGLVEVLAGLRPLPGPDFRGPVRAVGWHEGEYPEGLRRLETPPPALFVASQDGPLPGTPHCVALVGARRASEEGLSVAYDLARGLAGHGLVVVSGLAMGVDAAAHRGALDGGGKTLAVLASSVDDPTPRRHEELARTVAKGGGWLVSERPPSAPVRPGDFPRRNRLIAGLSELVVVVEAGLRSGTLSTVECALAAGVDVAAVPGPTGRPSCRGSNALLRRGARWVESLDDILALLGRRARVQDGAAAPDPHEQAVLAGVSDSAASLDRWVGASRLPGAQARSALSRLISRGVLRRLPSGRIGRVL